MNKLQLLCWRLNFGGMRYKPCRLQREGADAATLAGLFAPQLPPQVAELASLRNCRLKQFRAENTHDQRGKEH